MEVDINGCCERSALLVYARNLLLSQSFMDLTGRYCTPVQIVCPFLGRQLLHGFGTFRSAYRNRAARASLDPLSLIALDALGRANVIAGSPREGLVHYGRALEIDPTFRTALEGRAYAFDRLGEHDRAIEEHLRYRALMPGGVGAWAAQST